MPWYNDSWTKRFKITSDQTKVDEAIDNLFFDLSLAPSGFWSAVKSDGGDIRVTQADGITEVAREVSGFNQGSQLGSLFFKATGLSASADTDFYIYYGNPAASEPAAADTFGKNNVWTSYLCVWHLDETSGNVTCSKSNVTGTVTGVPLGGTGKLRLSAGSWADAGDEIDAGDNFDITAASLSITAWGNPSTLAFDAVIVQKMPGTNTNGYHFIFITSSARLRVVIADAAGFSGANSNASAISTGSFQHMVATYDGANVRFYVNSSAFGVVAVTRIPTGSTSAFNIGSDGGFTNWSGQLDEIRVSTSVRSANWITTEYNNQNDPGTFWTEGVQEDVPSGNFPFITTIGAKRI